MGRTLPADDEGDRTAKGKVKRHSLNADRTEGTYGL